MKKKSIIFLILLFWSFHLQSQTITFPIQMDSQAFKDSLIALFNYPVKPKSPEGFSDQLFARFPWIKIINNHPRYHLSFSFEGDDLLAGYGHLKSIQISSVNSVNGRSLGDYAPISFPFATFNTGEVFTTAELNKKNGFRNVSTLQSGYYRINYFLPDGYDKAGIIFQVVKEDPKEYKSVTRPDGAKFDKDGSDVISGYIIRKIEREDFDEDSNLDFSEKDWEDLDALQRSYFANYFFNKHIAYFQKYSIEREVLEPIIAGKYLLKSEKEPDLDAAVASYKFQQKVPEYYELLQAEYKLLGPFGIDEANNSMISSTIYPCIDGNCIFGEGTVDMGKTTYTGTFDNSFATSGIITEKSSDIKIKVNFRTGNSKQLAKGEYLSDPNLTASFIRKNDSIYFDVDTPTFSYVGTTKGLSGRSGIVDGIHTIKKETHLEIYTYKNGIADSKSATIRERSVGEFEYTGAFKQSEEGDIYPFGEGRVGFPYFSDETVPITVTSTLFEAIQESPEAMGLLVSIFAEQEEINTPYFKKWHQEYLSLVDANRYEMIQKLSDEELVGYVLRENEKKLKYLNVANGNLSELINRDWIRENGSWTIMLINKKDGPSSLCLRTQTGGIAQVRYNYDEKCVSFEKRGDVMEVDLKFLREGRTQIKLICDDCSVDDYYAIAF